MRNLTSSLSAMVVWGLMTMPATAQQIDNTANLPEAQPGECFAKVRTPAVYETRTREIILEAASERIDTIDAEYKTGETQIVLKDSAEMLTVTDTVYETETERFEVRPAETRWSSVNGESIQTDSDAMKTIAASGVDIEAAEVGTCFVEYMVEPQYETRTRQVKVKEATEKITIVPPQYETVQERVETRAATKNVIHVPAVYRTESESVLVEPARDVWQQCGPVEKADNASADVMCMVRMPERYETLTKTVLETPASTKTVDVPAVYETVEVQRLVKSAQAIREEIPAEYQSVSRQVKIADPEYFWLAEGSEPETSAKPTGRVICKVLIEAEYTTIERQVVAEPAKTTASVIPAEYTTVAVEELVTPATERRTVIPARTRTESSRVQISPAQLDWKQVLCEQDMDREMIASIQQALSAEGFDPGPIDGIQGSATLDALEQFQTEKGLGGGVLTFESLDLLGIEPPAASEAELSN